MKIKNKQELLKSGYSIHDDIIKHININVIAHFGNIPCIELINSLDANIFPSYNLFVSLGYVLKNIVELLNISREDGLRLTTLKNIPIRVIKDNNYNIVGIGNFAEDKFMFFQDMLLKEKMFIT